MARPPGRTPPTACPPGPHRARPAPTGRGTRSASTGTRCWSTAGAWSLWSGEMHPFRLPSPSLWRDVLQKMRAHGYNAVSVYVAWNYHSPGPGQLRLHGRPRPRPVPADGRRDRPVRHPAPGPVHQRGGRRRRFPRLADGDRGPGPHLRPDLSVVRRRVAEAQVDAIVARHLFTKGTGTVLLYQIENEYDASRRRAPRPRLHVPPVQEGARRRDRRAAVPQRQGPQRLLDPGSASTPAASRAGWLYGFDGYPSTRPKRRRTGATSATGGAKGGATASPRTPGFIAEFGGGWFDPWGGAAFAGKGYAEARRTRDAAYERRFYLTNLANGITVHNVYMTFGGTSWGWLPAPVVYTSYDYGAAFDEARAADPEARARCTRSANCCGPCRTSPSWTGPDAVTADGRAAEGLPPDQPGHRLPRLRRCATTPTTPHHLDDAGRRDRRARSPSPAQDARLLAAGLPSGGRTLKYATAQPMMCLTAGRQDIAVFTGRARRDGAGRAGRARGAGGHRLDARARVGLRPRTAARRPRRLGVGGLTRVRVEGGGAARPLLLLFADDATALTAVAARHPGGPGPGVRPVAAARRRPCAATTVAPDRRHRRRDRPGGVGAARQCTEVTWNGRPLRTRVTRHRQPAGRRQLAARCRRRCRCPR